MSTSHDNLERIKEAYYDGDHGELKDACSDLLRWVPVGGDFLTITEPQLSVMTIMCLAYARARLAMTSAEKE